MILKLPMCLILPSDLDIHGCVFSTVAADALVLKYRAVSIHSADKVFIVLGQFPMEILHSLWITLENETTFWENDPDLDFQGLILPTMLLVTVNDLITLTVYKLIAQNVWK